MWPLYGRPDFVFPADRLAVFVDGCFWHGCPKHYTRPANNRAFWERKLRANRARDRQVNRELKRLGWRVLRVWEHDLRQPNRRCMARLRRLLALP
jgi:DNA mismatch endonuclease (patch repair protein)